MMRRAAVLSSHIMKMMSNTQQLVQIGDRASRQVVLSIVNRVLACFNKVQRQGDLPIVGKGSILVFSDSSCLVQ